MKRKIVFISYASNNFVNRGRLIKKEAENMEMFNEVKVWGPNNLDNRFKMKFKTFLDRKKGGGFWIWKPYIIKTTMDGLNDGDILIYCDAGCVVNKKGRKRLEEYIDMLDKDEQELGVLRFEMGGDLLENQWTNSKVFEYFGVSKMDMKIRRSRQLVGGILLFKKTSHAVKCINEWYTTLYKIPNLFTNRFNGYNRIPEFRQHRHDQSVFSVICKKNGCIKLVDETFPFGGKKWTDLDDKPFHARRYGKNSR